MAHPADRAFYEIRVAGQLDAVWAAWFDGMAISARPGGEMLIAGPVADQAALHGLLARIRDLGLPLLAVTRLPLEASPGRDAGDVDAQ